MSEPSTAFPLTAALCVDRKCAHSELVHAHLPGNSMPLFTFTPPTPSPISDLSEETLEGLRGEIAELTRQRDKARKMFEGAEHARAKAEARLSALSHPSTDPSSPEPKA